MTDDQMFRMIVARMTAIQTTLGAVIGLLPAFGATTVQQMEERTEAFRDLQKHLLEKCAEHVDGLSIPADWKEQQRQDMAEVIEHMFVGLDESEVLAALIQKVQSQPTGH